MGLRPIRIRAMATGTVITVILVALNTLPIPLHRAWQRAERVRRGQVMLGPGFPNTRPGTRKYAR